MAVRPKVRSPFPSTESDWAAAACMRSDWTTEADLLVATWNTPGPRLELATGGVPLFAGEWEIALRLAGEAVELHKAWDCSCWFSDRDGDYLELQQTFDHGLHIERQIYLSRRERFMILADCISGVDLAHIEYRSRLPRLADLSAEANTDTREIRLKSGRRQRARVFPAILPDDRVHSAPGSLTIDDHGQLALQLKDQGGLYAPVIIDWEPRRRRSLADWSRLTVTENNRLLRSADAAGCRLRIGNHQLVCYRSLSKGEAARAMLGLHTPNETVIGRFNTDGEVEVLVQVE